MSDPFEASNPPAGWGGPGFTGPEGMVPVPAIGAGPGSRLAIVAFLLSLTSFFCLGLLTGIPAVLLGLRAYRRLRESPPLLQQGRGVAIAAVVLGGLGSLWSLVWIVVQISFR
jgi:hypothetical protein